ncbi:MAG: hypothetical protein E6H07_06720 [Bacteroidetes bacterium]|nr:MAG: hypothetical protein E6H07_06720 [Bacteroidota bacterium]
MQSKAKTPDDYIAELPADRKEAIIKLRKEVLKNLPKGFKEVMGYGAMDYVVPHSIYPAGYHCTPSDPCLLQVLQAKNILSLSIIWVFILIPSSWPNAASLE